MYSICKPRTGGRRVRSVLLSLCASLVLNIFPTPTVAVASDMEKKVPRVVVIGVDAMSPNGIVNAQTPVMDQLMAEGAYTLGARGVLPTSSSTNWMSMVSGAGPEQHGVTSNSWERDDHILPPVVTGMENIFPTVFSLAREQRPTIKIGAIYTWEAFGRLIERSALDYYKSGKDDVETVQLAADYIKKEKPDFLFIHLDEVDAVGHHDGHKTPAYYASVARADTYIGEIINATKEAGTFEETVFIISSDHGGYGYGHGGETLDEIEIPLIVYGSNVKQGYVIREQVYIYDHAGTMAFLLGIKPHHAWIGQAIKSAFKGYPDPDIPGLVSKIAAPTLYPTEKFYDPAGGLFVDAQADVRIDSTVAGSEIYFTLDGSDPTRADRKYKGPFKLERSAVVKAKAFKGDTLSSNASTGFYQVVQTGEGNGVHFEYFEGEDDWRFLPQFETMKPTHSGTVHRFRIGDISQTDRNYGIRYTAWLQIDTEGEYKFYIVSDDGSKIYVDDTLVADNDGGHGPKERAGKISLTPGRHKITVEYFNGYGGAWLDAFYRGPNITKQIIPADKLFLSKE